MLPVLFLDIDGVLNRCGLSGQGLESDKVTLLHRLLEAAPCHVVIISTWRLFEHTLARVELLMRDLGVRQWSCTPQLPAGRDAEISAWLAQHPGVPHYVVVDDDINPATSPHAAHLVKTDSFTGLTPVLAHKIYSKLVLP